MRPTYLLGVAQAPPVLGMAGSLSEPMIWDRPKSPTWRPRYAKPKAAVCWVQDMLGSEVCTLKTYLGPDIN